MKSSITKKWKTIEEYVYHLKSTKSTIDVVDFVRNIFEIQNVLIDSAFVMLILQYYPLNDIFNCFCIHYTYLVEYNIVTSKDDPQQYLKNCGLVEKKDYIQIGDYIKLSLNGFKVCLLSSKKSKKYIIQYSILEYAIYQHQSILKYIEYNDDHIQELYSIKKQMDKYTKSVESKYDLITNTLTSQQEYIYLFHHEIQHISKKMDEIYTALEKNIEKEEFTLL